MRARRSLSFVALAALAIVACSTADQQPVAGSAGTPSTDQPGRNQPGVAPQRMRHTFDDVPEKDRARIFDLMEHQGAVAAGLQPDFDPDFVRREAERRERDSKDVAVNGLTEPATQSETSIAANTTGTILIGGYNDATGFPANPSQTTLSLSGVARSSDGGKTWTPVLVGPNGSGTLPTVNNGSVFGDPDVKYDPTRDVFFYASIYVRPSDRLQGMSVHMSNSGANAGTSWSNPQEVGPAFASGHAADKEFIDVNTRTGRILLSWTDFQSSPSAAQFIKSTFSDDGGVTWSAAATLASPVSPDFVQGSVPRFLPAATNDTSGAYVVWRDGGGNGNTSRNVGCARSTDGGATWSPAVELDSNNFAPEDFIPGVDRVATSPAMAVDYTSGRVYVVYQRNDAQGTGDVALRTFTGDCVAGAPMILSSNPGNDRAQFMPWVTVDQSTQSVHVLWYDNGHDATGDVIEVMHTMSRDQGATWTPPTPLVDRPFHAGFGNDTGQPNMGDYIQGVAQNGVLHTLWGSVSVEPTFSEGLPSASLICPDSYYDQAKDTDEVAPIRLTGTTFTEASCGAGGNGNIDPGETISLSATLENYVTNATVGAAGIGTISGTLSTTTPGVTITQATSAWGDLAAGASGANSGPLQFSVASNFVAGTEIDFVLTVQSSAGTASLPFRAFTGTPGTSTVAINENFESATIPTLPNGWSSVVGGPNGAVDPWVSSSAFSPFPVSTKFAYHPEGTTTDFIRLFSPAVTLPNTAQAVVTLDFDLAYRLEDEVTQKYTAYDGLTVRLTDATGGTVLRSVLAEAFAQQLKTGSINHFPKHLPRANSSAYFQDMSVWSGDSGPNVQHVSMRFPGTGMVGRNVQLRFEYTQDASGVCTDNGYAAPCGVGIDNVKLAVVPMVDNHCANADLSITKTGTPSPVYVNQNETYTLTVANAGPDNATSVKVVDTLPAGTTFVSANGAGWTCGIGGNTVTCTQASLASGATASPITVIVTAPSTTGQIVNSATVSSTVVDPNNTNDTASVTTQVVAPVCGNSVVEMGEQCDDGVANGTASDCCSASCQFQSASTTCRPAADQCDVAEMCTGSAAACPADGKQPDNTGCNDNNSCTQTDTCQMGACVGGNPVTCTAQDECHDVGMCQSNSGTCTNPNKQDGTPCSIGTCMGGVCTATPDAGADAGDMDAGVDAGDMDAGSDSGTGTDAGTDAGNPVDAGTDSGTKTDAGGGTDAGNPIDAGGKPDAGNKTDAGGGNRDSGATADAAGDASEGGGGGGGDDSGCGCKVVQKHDTSPGALAGFGAFGLFALLRLRRRRRS